MKQTIFIFLCFSHYVLAQTFHFTHFIEYENQRLKPNPGTFYRHMFVNEDNEEILFVSTYETGGIAFLIDASKNYVHNFDVFYSKQNKKLDFKYAFTRKSLTGKFVKYNQKWMTDKNVEVEVTEAGNDTFEASFFKKNKPEKAIIKVDILLETNPFNFLYLGIDHYSGHLISEKLKSLLPNENHFIIKRYTTTRDDGTIIKTALKQLQTTSLTINLPKELTIRH